MVEAALVIGVFDSGYGGLTIFQKLIETFPEYSFTYLGDNARAPYGNKSVEEIIEYTKQGVDALFQRGCTIVILGCNTASAVALRDLQQNWLPTAWPDRKLLGIVVPTIEQITTTADPVTVGILATERTVASGAYEHEIQKRNPHVRVFQFSCTNLAGMIELYGARDSSVQAEATSCVQQLLLTIPTAAPSAVLLGCTHYELIADTIAAALPQGTTLLHQPTIVAKSLQDYLSRHPEIESRLEKKGTYTYLTTGNAEEVTAHSKYFVEGSIKFIAV